MSDKPDRAEIDSIRGFYGHDEYRRLLRVARDIDFHGVRANELPRDLLLIALANYWEMVWQYGVFHKMGDS